MLYNRYNQPLNLLDNFIPCSLLCKFIDYFLDSVNQAQIWEFWLHKETGKTWGDFMSDAVPQSVNTQKLYESTEMIEKKLMRGGRWFNGNI